MAIEDKAAEIKAAEVVEVKHEIAKEKAVAAGVATTTSSKAIVAGGVAAIVTPLNNVLQWLFLTYLHMPDNVAYSAGMVVCGLLGWVATYYIPNKPKETQVDG